jgi:hypothetical protein
MKKLSLFLLITLVTIQLSAQKAKDKNVSITYERWPLIGVDSAFKTYWASVKYNYPGAPGPTSALNLKGVKKFTYDIGNPYCIVLFPLTILWVLRRQLPFHILSV